MSLFCRGKEISVTHKNFLFVGWDSLSVVYLASESGCRSGDEGRRGSQSLVWGSEGLWVSRCLRRRRRVLQQERELEQ